MTTLHPEVIVVLGARVLRDGSLGVALRRRVDRAAQAWHHGLAPVIICSGGRRWAGHVEAECMRRALVAMGVPASSVLVETRSLSTADNARYTARLLRGSDTQSVHLVSCPWHLPRAVADFKQCGLPAIPVSTAQASHSRRWLAWRSIVEQVCRCMDRVRLMGEATS